jgi:hypothetical protein
MRVVVVLGFFAAEVQIQQARFHTYWLSGFFRDDSYPNRAIAGQLFLTALRHCDSVVACGGPAPRTRELYRACGLIELERLHRFVCFYRVRPIVKKYVHSRLLASLLIVATDPLRRLYYALRFPRWTRRLSFRRVKRFSTELDSLLARDTRNCFVKSSAKLNWVLEHRSLDSFEIRRGEHLVGYCILRCSTSPATGGPHNLPSVSIGCLLDYYIDGDSTESRVDLLHWAIRHFENSEVEVFECQCQETSMLAACAKLGLKKIGGNYVGLKPPDGLACSHETPWFYTHGTSDSLLG